MVQTEQDRSVGRGVESGAQPVESVVGQPPRGLTGNAGIQEYDGGFADPVRLVERFVGRGLTE